MPNISDKLQRAVVSFAQAQTTFKRAESEFKKQKSEFYSVMGRAFDDGDIEKKTEFDRIGKHFTVTRSQRVSVEFDAEALSSKLPKSVRDAVIIKSYSVDDIQGLVEYVKQLGGDPKTFKSFMRVEKSVDTEELDRLFSIGEVERDVIDGCYSVKTGVASFMVKEKVKDDNEGCTA